MNKTICPGQDTRFWHPGDIFDSRCGNCGNIIEFFKDDASQKCKKCGTRVQNPRLNMGCAQWCEHAKECLGYDPKTGDESFDNLGYDISLADKILNEIKSRFGEESGKYRLAVEGRKKVDELLEARAGKPRIVIPAALLAGVDENGGGKGDDIPVAEAIMKEVKLDNATIYDVTDIIKGIRKSVSTETEEYRIVEDVINLCKEGLNKKES